ncbi:DUF6882 domain-containing protein [Chondromyces apiculatus]|uniref:LSU ribosomal protein L22e n=1 Tax=Chondromyces apiculatus DSM 436 TaxID=1192034 RepID=A0A017T011_9BACT|nr:DUF6882 domain-containing protein [Chondromyces apiculatus]EYF02195.1 LSU ribosomal protein L22e [Chondromyces apiculatus DSM 436]
MEAKAERRTAQRGAGPATKPTAQTARADAPLARPKRIKKTEKDAPLRSAKVDPPAPGTPGAPGAPGAPGMRGTRPTRREPPRVAQVKALEQGHLAPLPERSPPPRPLISAGSAPQPPPQEPELDWDDQPVKDSCDVLAQRWALRGQELFQLLNEHGAAQHEVRVNLKDGLFVWVDGKGRVSAEARAQVLCSFCQATSVVSMAWADPLVRAAAVPRIDGMLSERDDIDEEGAWQVAMEAAEACCASYLYRVSAPHAWYFLGLTGLTFRPARKRFNPGPPVGLVLRALAEVRLAIAGRAEPCDVVRDRLRALGNALFHQAEYTYRGTDWVARLERTGRCLLQLGKRLPRPSFTAVASGQAVEDWLGRDLALELVKSVELLEDEWTPFS